MENEVFSPSLRRLHESTPGRLQSASDVISKLSAHQILSQVGEGNLLQEEAKIGNDDNCWALLDRAEKTSCLTDLVASVNEVGRTAFQIACDQGHKLVVQVLLAAGAPWICHTPAEDHPFVLAALKGHWDVCSIMQKHNFAAFTMTFKDVGATETVLKQALRHRKADLASLALKYGELDYASMALTRCLEVACEAADDQICKMLLDKGAVVSIKCRNAAIIHGGSVELLRTLIRHVGPQIMDDNAAVCPVMMTPLQCAFKSNRIDVVEFLLHEVKVKITHWPHTYLYAYSCGVDERIIKELENHQLVFRTSIASTAVVRTRAVPLLHTDNEKDSSLAAAKAHVMQLAESGTFIDSKSLTSLTARYYSVSVLQVLMELDVAIENADKVLKLLLYKQNRNNTTVQDKILCGTDIGAFITNCLNYGVDLINAFSFLRAVVPQQEADHQSRYFTRNIKTWLYTFVDMGALDEFPYVICHLNYPPNLDGSFHGITRTTSQQQKAASSNLHHRKLLIVQIYADLIFAKQYDLVAVMIQASPAFRNFCFIDLHELHPHDEFDPYHGLAPAPPTRVFRDNYCADFITRMILDCGLNKDAISIPRSSTLLMDACSMVSIEAVGLLLAAGADVNKQDVNQRTCLHYLADRLKDQPNRAPTPGRKTDVEKAKMIITLLLQAGIDTSICIPLYDNRPIGEIFKGYGFPHLAMMVNQS